MIDKATSRNKTKNIIIAITSVIFVAFFSLFLLNAFRSSGNFIVQNLNVGKADAALIIHNERLGIIDTGTKEQYKYVADSIDETGIKTISFMILTHYDEDHVGNAVKLLQNYKVEQIFVPDYVSEKENYESVMQELRKHENVHFLSEDTSYNWHGVKIDFITLKDKKLLQKEKPDNNASLVSIFTYGSNRFLFAGDIEKNRINELVETNADIKCDYIKIPHHGTKEKPILKFVEEASPKYAVISTSAERDEAKHTKKSLQECGIDTYDTCMGDIIVTSDGKDIKIIY